MSKGWYVKVETNVVFTVDTNVGVVASCEREAANEAVSFVESNLDCHGEHFKEVLERVLPSELNMGGMEWNRGSMSGEVDFDTMQAVIIEPDPDFDEDQGPSADVRSLMEAAQCLNEAYHNLPEDHPLKNWQVIYGIAEVRDQLSKIAVYCDMTHRVMHEDQNYGEYYFQSFDLDFVPQFLQNCVDNEFEVKSENPHILSMYWSAF